MKHTLSHNNHEKYYGDKIICSTDTKQKLLVQCKNVYLKHHPDMKEIHLPQGFLLKKVIEFYLKDE